MSRLLHRAVADGCGAAAIVSFLLAHNANPASKNSGGKTPIEVGIFNWGNRKDEIKAFENCCITLLSRSNGACDELGDDAFELLIANNISLTTENKSQQTPLDVLYEVVNWDCINAFNNAVAEKIFSTYSYEPYYQEIKKLLKDVLFDINFCGKDGKTLLRRAAESYPDKCSLLLKNGATVTQAIIDSACSDEVRALLQKKYDELGKFL